jgi:hypothetical protein
MVRQTLAIDEITPTIPETSRTCLHEHVSNIPGVCCLIKAFSEQAHKLTGMGRSGAAEYGF